MKENKRERVYFTHTRGKSKRNEGSKCTVKVIVLRGKDGRQEQVNR